MVINWMMNLSFLGPQGPLVEPSMSRPPVRNNFSVRHHVPLKPHILSKLMMSAIQTRTKIQIKKTNTKTERQRQIKGKPMTPMM